MYLVFVCPKCKLNAQLLEPGHKTVTCQRCSAKIQTNSLRFFGSFEDRNEAVKLRSVLQGQLSGSFSGDTELLSLSDEAVSIKEPKKGSEVQTKMPKAPKPVDIICSVLSEKGPMILIDCEYYCEERGVDPETFQKILQKMIEAGVIFRPEKGIIALVP
ncbi:MAG: hypothetical protein FWH46_01235 [Methanimicrococcus sp.]|nr:hypothetical protein [Methanimicrococcus sp.]